MKTLTLMGITAACMTAFLHFNQVSYIVGDSMEPNYHNGEVVLVKKKGNQFQYGDVVIVRHKKMQLIKRIIGLPGDRVSYKDHQVYRNDTLLDEPYIKEEMNNGSWEVSVPEGCIFVMGDHRNDSLDSRNVGCFSIKDDVIGKVIYKLLKEK